jgi:hypothetical protein
VVNRKPCNCPKCLRATRQEGNTERARAADITVICVGCGKADVEPVGRVLAKRGRVLCSGCDGRKR